MSLDARDGNADPQAVAEVKRVTWIGLGVNVALAALKFACGIIGSSQALVADAVHSLSDCSTDLAILIGVHLLHEHLARGGRIGAWLLGHEGKGRAQQQGGDDGLHVVCLLWKSAVRPLTGNPERGLQPLD